MNVLVVDDDPTTLKLVTAILRKNQHAAIAKPLMNAEIMELIEP